MNAPRFRPKWLRKLLLAAAWLAGGALLAVDYEHSPDMVTGADADIKLTVPGGQMPQSGFLPMRVRITNRNSSERSWQLELTAAPMGGYQMGAELNSVSTFAVPGGSTHEFFVFAPLSSSLDRRPVMMAAEITGPQVESGRFPLGLNFSWGVTHAPFAVDPALEGELGRLLASNDIATKLGRPSAKYLGAKIQNASVIDPAQWPADWRLWSSFTTVLLADATWQRLDTARRQALLDWVALGGRLVKYEGKEGFQTWGGGDIRTRAGPVTAAFGNDIPSLGFDRAGEWAGPDLWKLESRDWQRQGKHRWLTAYIIVFGVLIGPVNLFFLAPAGRRHRLFLTVPVISLGASLVLFVIITIGDGFGGEGTRRALVLLQPGQNRAVVFQRQISRTGLLGDRKFALPADTIMNLEADDNQAMLANQQLWREDNAASGDWFASRSTQRHSLRRLVPTRERVELVSPAGAAPVVQSTVNDTLRDFLYVDDAGALWATAEVAPGKRVPLVSEPRTRIPSQHEVARYALNLNRGTFYALGGSGDGLIATLPAIRWRDDRVLYTGRFNLQEGAP